MSSTPNEQAKRIKLTNPGNIDDSRGPYPTLAAANLAIPNTMVEGESYRKGKFVEIGAAAPYKTYWWSGTDYADNKLVEYFSELTKKTDLFAVPPDKITAMTTGYWASSAVDSSAITASATLNHTNLIDCAPGDKFVIQGMTSATKTNTAGSFAHYFSVTGSRLFYQGSAVLVADGADWILTAPSTVGIVKFGINAHNTDLPNIKIRKGASSFDVGEKVKPEWLLTPVTKTSQLQNDSQFVYVADLTPMRNKLMIMDNGAGSPDYGFVVTAISGGLSITWTGPILLSYTNDPSSSVNRYSHLIASSGTRTITLDSTNATTCYVKKSDFVGTTAEIIPVYYCRWGDDVLKDPNTLILITKNKSQALKDCTGIFADYVRNSLNENRISALEGAAPENVAFLTSDNESQNLFLRGKASKPDLTGKKYGIIAAGQSNTDGRVLMVDAPIWLNQADPTLAGVKMWNRGSQAFADFKLGVNPGSDSNASTLWAYDMVVYQMLQDYLNDDIYVVKRTRGGCAISEFGTNGGGYWDAYFERVPSGVVLMNSLEQQIRAAKAASSAFEFKAFIWHQGEGDYASPAQDDYYQNFKNVIAYVRGIVDNPKLPVIYGSISTVSAQYSAVVKAAQVKIASEDPYCFFIDMGAAALLDSYHFNAASSISLGEQVFDLIKDL
ncbi:sialate O-acetylesterase [Pedobacter ginsengisoli]|uniref:sialate O-acetylesterase n=1 Tax=Pedobacter ginsengisoli TaxID=363852 RepID=UPI00254DB67B|nr:sialate O-acetylesterase [Pedobacter ginsengisoli]